MPEESGTSKVFWKDVEEAAKKAVKDKFCFNCANWRPKENGSLIKRGKTTQWKCFPCQKKLRF